MKKITFLILYLLVTSKLFSQNKLENDSLLESFLGQTNLALKNYFIKNDIAFTCRETYGKPASIVGMYYNLDNNKVILVYFDKSWIASFSHPEKKDCEKFNLFMSSTISKIQVISNEELIKTFDFKREN